MREVFSGLLSGQGLLVFIRSLAGEQVNEADQRLFANWKFWVDIAVSHHVENMG